MSKKISACALSTILNPDVHILQTGWFAFPKGEQSEGDLNVVERKE